MVTRNTHSLDDFLHAGREPASAIELSDDIGPFEAGTTVQEFLEAISTIVVASQASGFSIDAVVKRSISGIVPWAWVRRMTGLVDDFDYIYRIAYGNGMWVAVGFTDEFGGQMYWSRGAVGPWTRQPGWVGDLVGVTTDGTTWAVAQSGTILTNSDPSVDHWWAPRATEIGPLEDIYYANGRWVAWGATGAGPRLCTATSATGTWTSRSTDNFDFTGPIDIIYANSTWVCISGTATISTASDPAGTWTNLGAVGPGGSTRIAYGGGYWIVAGSKIISGVRHGGPWYATSLSGPWTEASTPLTFSLDVLWDGSRFVAVGFDNTFAALRMVVATNPSGTWTEVTAPDLDDLYRIGFDGTAYLAAGISGDNRGYAAIESTFGPRAYTAFTIDAYTNRKLTLDATVRRPASSSFTANAVINGTQLSNFTIDAVVFALHWTLDAVIGRTTAGSFTADAFVHGKFSINATITGFTIDAVIVGLDEALNYAYFDGDLWFDSLTYGEGAQLGRRNFGG